MDLELNSTAERKAEEAQHYPAFSSINLRHIRGEVSEALSHFGRLGLLEEYTKHDITHIDAMLAMYDWMIPTDTRGLMTPADWLLVTLTTYLHDFGLMVTRDEFDARHQLQKYVHYRQRILENDDPQVRDYRAQVLNMKDEEADRFLYQEFVRAYHAQRIRAWLLDSPDPGWGMDVRIVQRLQDLLSGVEETFREDVGIVCESHHLDDLNDLKKYPLNKPYGSTREQEANVQYAAFLLRTSDLLHITRDRVPSMSALVINPRNPKSQVEWAKQHAVRTVRPLEPPIPPDASDARVVRDTIEVHATFKEAEGFFGLTSYLNYAARQLVQTFNWSRENQASGASNYLFPWRKMDTTHIEARGFVAEPFEFTIDQAKILDLLTGHTLYNDTGVVVRELVQNSLDAVRLQQAIAGASFEPRIEVTWNSDGRVLSVADNGTGMTQSVIEQNFLRVGSSRYQDPQFQKEHPDFASISRFGIGVLSTFMVADDVSVLTSNVNEGHARQLSLRDVHGQYLVRLIDKKSPDVPAFVQEHGTIVRLKLRPSAELTSISDILRHWVILPGCRLTLTVDNHPPMVIGHQSMEDALTATLIESKSGKLDNGCLTTAYGAPLEVRSYRAPGVEVAFAVTWNRWLQEWNFVRNDQDRARIQEERSLPASGVSVGGVRVTSEAPGYRAGGVVAMANAHGKGAPRTNVARSALERTEEYERLLQQIYKAYSQHVTSEMSELESARAASLTFAAQEAEYLVSAIINGVPVSEEALDREIRRLPSIVVEEAGVRTRRSLEDLSSVAKLATLEGTMIESFESVLRSVRGVGSASLGKLLEAMGGGSHVLPADPLVCALSGRGLFASLFTSEWEVTRFQTDEDARQLQAEWQPKAQSPRWAAPPRFVPHEAEEGWSAPVEGFGQSFEITRRLRLCTIERLDRSGFSENLVSCLGRIFVLPEHPIMAVRAQQTDMPTPLYHWCIGFLLSALLSPGSERSATSGFRNSIPPRRLSDTDRLLSETLNTARSAGMFMLLDEESVTTALSAAVQDLDILDVQRWDRRVE
jgi:molecular chaperone HtpG